MSDLVENTEILVPRRLFSFEDDDNVSVLTQDPRLFAPKVKKTRNGPPDLNPEKKKEEQVVVDFNKLTLVTDPTDIKAAIGMATMFMPKRYKGKIADRDLNVLKLDFLNFCPKKNLRRLCRCIEMTVFNGTDFQHDIRMVYCLIVKHGSHDAGNEFLKTFMLPKTEAMVSYFCKEWTASDHHLQLLVPVFLDDMECRRFKLCPTQFKKLFGLSNKRFNKLVKQRKKEWPDIQEYDYYGYPMYSCGWSRNNLRFYTLGNMDYCVVDDTCYEDYCELNEYDAVAVV
jgi:hypothetical protein